MIINRKTRIALALAALLGFAWGPVLGLPADADPASPAPSWAEDYSPCVVEDGPAPCYWDAGNRGNGRGRSFIILSDGTTDYAAAGKAGAPFCQFDAYGHDIGVTGYGFKPGAKVTARVNGRTLRGKLGNVRPYGHEWRTKGSYTQDDVRVRVNGRLCEGT